MGEASCAKKIGIEVGHSEVERNEIGRSEVWAKRGWTSLLERSEPNVTN